ncbi:MAG: Mur ligase domain-containing protein [Chitinophagaceae bacterium]|nr:Mur ligase domain-containing protein [Chitinophagaceae bacterium]
MRVHFISIGGSVMHQLAIALKKKGYQVSGSDDEIFEPSCTNLQQNDLLPTTMGWHPEVITSDIEAVILGMHAKADNPEISKAKELSLPIYSFPGYIFEESKQKIRVIVGGSHGKTTTTAMIMHVLKYAQKNFDYLVGARINGFEQSVNITDAPVIVCEGDEYPASTIERRPKFHFLFPHIAIITGIAWDHINIFPTFENYLEQFKIFIEKIESGGLLIYNQTDTVLAELVESCDRKDICYQAYKVPEFIISNGRTSVTIAGVSGALNVFGNHNLLNMQAAYYACNQLGINAETFLKGIGTFEGASRRMELLASNSTTSIYRDFAHAPSKVKATIEAAKQQFANRQLLAVLELHTFSSLNEVFMQQYNGAMELADKAVVFYSNHALELKRMPPLPEASVQKGFNKTGLEVITQKEALQEWLNKQDLKNANLLFMSSGNYDGLDIATFAKENV